LQPGVSVARLAREFGINANHVLRWIREHGQLRKRASVAASTVVGSPFVVAPVLRAAVERDAHELDGVRDMGLQARLPNGVAVELRGVGPRQLAEVLQMLGRLTCRNFGAPDGQSQELAHHLVEGGGVSPLRPSSTGRGEATHSVPCAADSRFSKCKSSLT
jgi:transposase